MPSFFVRSILGSRTLLLQACQIPFTLRSWSFYTQNPYFPNLKTKVPVAYMALSTEAVVAIISLLVTSVPGFWVFRLLRNVEGRRREHTQQRRRQTETHVPHRQHVCDHCFVFGFFCTPSLPLCGVSFGPYTGKVSSYIVACVLHEAVMKRSNDRCDSRVTRIPSLPSHQGSIWWEMTVDRSKSCGFRRHGVGSPVVSLLTLFSCPSSKTK